MKVLTTVPALALLIIFSITSCKKENFTKNFPGTYIGTAVHTMFDTIVTTYPNAKMVITRLDNKFVKFTVTPDPANPNFTLIYQSEIAEDKVHFYHTSSGPRGIPMPIQQGTLTGDHLVFKATGIFMSPELDFTGERQ